MLSDVSQDAFKSIQLHIDLGRHDGEPVGAIPSSEAGADEEDDVLDRPDTLEGVIELGSAIKEHPGDTVLEISFSSPLVAYTTTMYAPSIDPGKWLLEINKKYQIGCTVQKA